MTKKIHQCHQCQRILGEKLIPCPDCSPEKEITLREFVELFSEVKGLTKDEADRYEKSLMKLFKPTGRNRFEDDSE